jgi:hypothetical protein
MPNKEERRRDILLHLTTRTAPRPRPGNQNLRGSVVHHDLRVLYVQRSASAAARSAVRCMLLLDGTLARLAYGRLSTTTLAGIFSGMTLKAHVRKGRLVVDEPTDLPEGTEVDLLPLDPGDWLDDEDRAALHRALTASGADIKAGRLTDANEVLRELRSK